MGYKRVSGIYIIIVINLIINHASILRGESWKNAVVELAQERVLSDESPSGKSLLMTCTLVLNLVRN